MMAALDFCRALNERGWIWKWLFRVAVGKYAHREFEIMRENLAILGHQPYWEYGCKGMSYHKETLQQLQESMRNPIHGTD